MRRRLFNAGFTLLELLVAISIFSVMAIMAYGGLSGVLKNRSHAEKFMERTAEFQRSYQRLRGDLQQVRNRPARDNYGDMQPPLRGDRDTRLEFTRAGWRNPLVQQRAGLERVSYRLVEKELRRESWRVLDQAQDSKLVSVTLMSNVEEMRLRYLGNNREWSDIWPPLSSTGGTQTIVPAPLAVEIKLTTKDWGEITYLFRLGMDPQSAQIGQPGGPGTGGQSNGQAGQDGQQQPGILTK